VLNGAIFENNLYICEGTNKPMKGKNQN